MTKRLHVVGKISRTWNNLATRCLWMGTSYVIITPYLNQHVPMSKAQLGKPAPAFNLPSTGEKSVRLSSLKGQNIVLYFYPRDATPGCTTESQDFRDAQAKFKRANTIILGISQDTIKSHEKFHARQSLNFDLLSDESGEVCTKYGVLKMKKMYGKEFQGIERSTFLIDSKGILKAEWRKVKVPGHVDEVLKESKLLNKA